MAVNVESTKLVKLRHDAETRLKAGSAPPTTGWSVGVNALSLLHKLASTPESAIDALKLLHELQVHQVELDLQHEQMEATQRDLAEDLAHFRRLYESAPVGYINMGPQRDIFEINDAAATLLGINRDDVLGRDFDAFLAPASRPVLLQLLKRLRADGASESCRVQMGTGSSARKLMVLASLPPGGRSFLLVLLDQTERS
jgi:PAS domain S-box-containing protein